MSELEFVCDHGTIQKSSWFENAYESSWLFVYFELT